MSRRQFVAIPVNAVLQILCKHRGMLQGRLFATSASGVICSVGNLAVTLLSYPIYLYFLGYDNLGLWSILSVLLTFLQLTNFGFAPAVTKFVAERTAVDDQHAIQRFVSTAITTTAIVSFASCLVVFLFRRQIIGFFGVAERFWGTSITMLPLIGLVSSYSLYAQIVAAVVPGMGQAAQANIRDTVCRFLSLGCATLFLWAGVGVFALLIAAAVYAAALHVLSWRLVAKRLDISLHKLQWSRNDYRALMKFGWGMAGSSIIGFLLHPIVKVVLTRHAGVEALPVFEISHNGSMQIRNVIEAGVRSLAPEISKRTFVDGSTEFAGRLRRLLTKIMFLCGGAVYAIVWLGAEWLLARWLGARYEHPIVDSFRVMLGASFISLVGVPSYYYLIGIGRTNHIFLANVAQSGTNLLLLAALVHWGGGISPYLACWSLFFGMLMSTVYLIIVSRRS